MKIIPLKEGNFSTDAAKDFTLLTEENMDALKGIKMSVTPFLIITERMLSCWMPGSAGKMKKEIR